MKKLIPERLKQNIESRAKADRACGWIDGIAISVCQSGDTVYEGCFGSLGMDGVEPVTSKTLFRLASMTKPITAVAVLQCVERGLMRLDDPISAYLPLPHLWPIAEMKEGKPEIIGQSRSPITLRQLLTHSSGIGCGEVGDHFGAKPENVTRPDLKSAIEGYATLPLSFEPGSAQAYSPLVAFDLLAGAVEQVSGRDYESYLRGNLFEPCDMPDTTFLPSEAQWSRLIAMHQRIDGQSAICPQPEGCMFAPFPVSHFLGASTLSDYSHFARMLLDGGCYGGRQILREESVRSLASPQLSGEIMPGNQNWGLGVRVITEESYGTLPKGTFGWSGAFGTHFWVDPTNRICAVYLKNSAWDGGSEAISAANFERDVHDALA